MHIYAHLCICMYIMYLICKKKLFESRQPLLWECEHKFVCVYPEWINKTKANKASMFVWVCVCVWRRYIYEGAHAPILFNFRQYDEIVFVCVCLKKRSSHAPRIASNIYILLIYIYEINSAWDDKWNIYYIYIEMGFLSAWT